MTNQQAFTKVCKHLMRQYRKAMSVDETSCVLRTSSGLRCAVGCLIPKSQYTPELENSLPSNLPDIVPVLEGVDKTLLDELTGIHDAFPIAEWASRLRALPGAIGMDLKIPECIKAEQPKKDR